MSTTKDSAGNSKRPSSGAAAGAAAASTASNKRVKTDDADVIADLKDDDPTMAWCSSCSKLVTNACRTADHPLQSADVALEELLRRFQASRKAIEAAEQAKTAAEKKMTAVEEAMTSLEGWMLERNGLKIEGTVSSCCPEEDYIDEHMPYCGDIIIALAVSGTRSEVEDLCAALEDMELEITADFASGGCEVPQELFDKLRPRVEDHLLPACTILTDGRSITIHHSQVEREEGEGERVLGRVTDNLEALTASEDCEGMVEKCNAGYYGPCKHCRVGANCCASLENVQVVEN